MVNLARDWPELNLDLTQNTWAQHVLEGLVFHLRAESFPFHFCIAPLPFLVVALLFWREDDGVGMMLYWLLTAAIVMAKVMLELDGDAAAWTQRWWRARVPMVHGTFLLYSSRFFSAPLFSFFLVRYDGGAWGLDVRQWRVREGDGFACLGMMVLDFGDFDEWDLD